MASTLVPALGRIRTDGVATSRARFVFGGLAAQAPADVRHHVELEEVLRVLGALDHQQVSCWATGGWGVDALVGRRTREHRDLDLAVDLRNWKTCLTVCAELGYVVETDWWPVRVEVASPRGWIDLHPVRFDESGDGLQAGLDGATFDYPQKDLTTGRVGDQNVRCLSADWQVRVHSGYEPRPKDLQDLAVMAALTDP